ncbi:MAG: MlaD family protein [Magnetospirillum sp.]|nr:MlaD family protein [Magnetospirillum sp.]
MRVKGEDRDAAIGAVVLAVAALLLAIVYGKEAGPGIAGGYDVIARFHRADGLAIGSEVRLSGVKVGKIVAERLDGDFRAVTTLSVARDVSLPSDTAAAIQTDGLLGSKFIELRPGAEETEIKPGGEISYTQDSMALDDLLEMIVDQARAKRGYLGKPLPNERL